MTKLPDKTVIRLYLNFAKREGWNQTEMAAKLFMTKAWASRLVRGHIKRLQFITRARMMQVMNIIDEDY